ncbi:MAG: hypothetical protein AAB853_05235 [Patescibacteria group bacterium]
MPAKTPLKTRPKKIVKRAPANTQPSFAKKGEEENEQANKHEDLETHFEEYEMSRSPGS